MKSGKIKKTTSYIMAIPMNDKDIDTPQMVYDRINAHDEFELKETSFDDKNMCPMVTVVYKGQQYIVDIKIEPVNITPDFMFCHDMPDECIKKMKKAKIGITTSLTFTDDIMESYHFQLKFLNCIIPDKAAVVDFNTHRIFSPLWIKSVAVSSVSPGPNYVFSVNMLRDKNNLHWVYTYGLNRCGFYELEVLNTEKASLDEAYKNEEINTMIHAIGAGVGSDFDIEDSRGHQHEEKVLINRCILESDLNHIYNILYKTFQKYN